METETKRQAKEWTKPELLVLARNKPEEAVLSACKTASSPSGPQNINSRCQLTPGICYNCNALAAS